MTRKCDILSDQNLSCDKKWFNFPGCHLPGDVDSGYGGGPHRRRRRQCARQHHRSRGVPAPHCPELLLLPHDLRLSRRQGGAQLTALDSGDMGCPHLASQQHDFPPHRPSDPQQKGEEVTRQGWGWSHSWLDRTRNWTWTRRRSQDPRRQQRTRSPRPEKPNAPQQQKTCPG